MVRTTPKVGLLNISYCRDIRFRSLYMSPCVLNKALDSVATAILLIESMKALVPASRSLGPVLPPSRVRSFSRGIKSTGVLLVSGGLMIKVVSKEPRCLRRIKSCPTLRGRPQRRST